MPDPFPDEVAQDWEEARRPADAARIFAPATSQIDDLIGYHYCSIFDNFEQKNSQIKCSNAHKLARSCNYGVCFTLGARAGNCALA